MQMISSDPCIQRRGTAQGRNLVMEGPEPRDPLWGGGSLGHGGNPTASTEVPPNTRPNRAREIFSRSRTLCSRDLDSLQRRAILYLRAETVGLPAVPWDPRRNLQVDFRRATANQFQEPPSSWPSPIGPSMGGPLRTQSKSKGLCAHRPSPREKLNQRRLERTLGNMQSTE